MTVIKAITYAESREEFFAKKLKQAERALNNVVKYGPFPDVCAEKGEIVSFYRDALEALREKAEREKGCVLCVYAINLEEPLDVKTHFGYTVTTPFNFCPACGRKLKEG